MIHMNGSCVISCILFEFCQKFVSLTNTWFRNGWVVLRIGLQEYVEYKSNVKLLIITTNTLQQMYSPMIHCFNNLTKLS